MFPATGVHRVIHAAALHSAGVGACLAHMPGWDAPVLAGIQAKLVVAIGEHYGVAVQLAEADELVARFRDAMPCRVVVPLVMGRVPVVGNVVNASTAAAFTRDVGWAAVGHFAGQDRGAATMSL